MQRRRTGCGASASALALVLLLSAPLSAGVHLQGVPSGGTVSFTPSGGNEWWVQVRLGGSEGGKAERVQAMDTGGPWTDLAPKTWTSDRTWWAKSFHVEPGNQVRFRATFPGGAVVESCWFTHPAASEHCEGPAPPPPPPAPGGFAATFTGVKGNAWWVQVNVAGNQPLAGVAARVDCGSTWHTLTLQSWGGWAKSFHVPSGSKVDFRARSTTGADAFSEGYTWPAATPTTGCGGTAPPPPPPTAWLSREAEEFAVRSAGGRVTMASASGGAAWNLWSNGFIEDRLASGGTGHLRIVASGTPLGGVWPQMVVRVDGAVVLTVTVASRSLTEYRAPAPPAGEHTVRIAFTNDAASSSEDRNLILDVVRIGAATPTDPDLKVAFLGDQGAGLGADSVLQLVRAEGADMAIHSGDFDYGDDPAAWDERITRILGADYPYFASVGNHDVTAWTGYQSKLKERLARIDGAACTGDLGVKSACTYRGLFFVLSGVGTLGTGHEAYLRDQLAADHSMWSVCSWHKNQQAMQVGEKTNEVGWGAYEACRLGGAIVATAHEHSYARTKTLIDTDAQAVDPDWPNPRSVRVAPGATFVFHSGLGGESVRPQLRCLPTTYPYGCHGEWASIYTTHQGATHGALFCTFSPRGIQDRAECSFRSVDGTTPDSFVVTSQMV